MPSTIALSPDESFNFEVFRNLAVTRYAGADIGEVLQAAAALKPGDFESYYDVWNKLALRIKGQADSIDPSKYPVSARDAYFRAATYLRSADFYLHGRPDDPRIDEIWSQMTACFDKAIALLPSPGERLVLKGDGFDIPAIYFRATTSNSSPKPTLILGNGFDGSQEELLHMFGFSALERGYNIITYEGPGQCSVRRQQGLGFTEQWEKVVSPVVDYVLRREDVDPSRVSLLGLSLGGFLCLRAAAFEHRLAAVVAVDAVYDFFPFITKVVPPTVRTAFEAGDANKVNELVGAMLASNDSPTTARWGIEHGLWSFAVDTPYEFMKRVQLMTLKGIAGNIKCPVMACEASDDMFAESDQLAQVKQAIGDLATHTIFTADDAANLHCHLGAFTFASQQVFDWLENVVSAK